MDQLRNILVGVDLDAGGDALTPGSRSAAAQALWLAQRTGARVEFLHSTFHDPESERPAPAEPGANVAAELAALAQEHGADVEGTGLTRNEERPWIALSRRAMAGEADLVVVAKRNHGKHDDRKLGSVSMKLVRKCPGPVWVVKPEHELRHRCVVAATDLSPVGDRATEYGAYIAAAEGCTLIVAHAWQVPMDLQLASGRVSDDEVTARKQQIAEAALAHIRGVPAVAALGSAAEVYLACDTPSHTVHSLVAQKNPDLVVMGTVSRGGIAGVLVGNTAEKLLYGLDCSLLTVKPDDFVCPLAGEG